MDLFHAHFPRLYRSVHRFCGESDLAADVAQDAFVRLYQRGAMPEAPEAWLISVALNLLRNVRSTQARRLRLLAREGVGATRVPATPSLGEAAADADTQRRVREAMDRLAERERLLLVLRADGYSYRDIAAVLSVSEASVGVLLARARRAFREAYTGTADAP